jgi:hypothetical protein
VSAAERRGPVQERATRIRTRLCLRRKHSQLDNTSAGRFFPRVRSDSAIMFCSVREMAVDKVVVSGGGGGGGGGDGGG